MTRSQQTTNFINVGERCNFSGSVKFKNLIIDQNFEGALEIARSQIVAGAMMLDINMDDAMIDTISSMRHFLRLLAAEPDIAKIPLMIDSSTFEVIMTALKNAQGKSCVNSISLKEGEESFIEQASLIKQFGPSVLVMAFDETKQAETAIEKVKVLSRSYEILTKKLGYNPRDIIFDPNIFAVATGIAEHQNYANEFFIASKQLREKYPHCHISGGVSNVSFSFQGNNYIRKAMHSVFLYHAINHGMSMAIINPGQIDNYARIDIKLRTIIEDILFNRNPNAENQLIDLAQESKLKESKSSTSKKVAKPRETDPKKRLQNAIIEGISKDIEKDLDIIINKGADPLELIETTLMDAMDIVGDYFGSGQMFLPQVVKSARVMKQSVKFLTPLIEAKRKLELGDKIDDKSSISITPKTKGKILLATVKGDVHDIGKNIVGVVLACQNFEIIDLGVMVPYNKILKAALDHSVDIIGLSGLVTPSLQEMCIVATQLQKDNFQIPLMIGGATTSKIHTAVKINPCYSQPVIYVPDASRAFKVASNLMDKQNIDNYLDEVSAEYTKIKSKHENKTKSTFVEFSKAKQNRYKLDKKLDKPSRPNFLGVKVLRDYPLAKIIPYIDWRPFFLAWEMKGNFPDILTNPKYCEVAKPLYDDALKFFDTIIEDKKYHPSAVFGLFEANSTWDDVWIKYNKNDKDFTHRFHFLRQQMDRSGSDRANFSLADFVWGKESGYKDYMGMFAVTAGNAIEELANSFKEEDNNYQAILIQAVSDRIVEAFAEYLHMRVRKEFHGKYPLENFSNTDLIKEKYKGIRPAPGYPACPDHHEKLTIGEVLNIEDNIGMKITPELSLFPSSSIIGYYFFAKDASYFGINRIGEDQLEDYAKRRNISIEEAKDNLFSLLD